MDSQRRVNQVAAWSRQRLDDFAAIYDHVQSAVWARGAFTVDEAGFVEAVTKAVRPHALAVQYDIEADDDDRTVTLLTTVSDGGGALQLGISFGWNAWDDEDHWRPDNTVNVFLDTGRVMVSLSVEERPRWRDAVPFADEPVPDCERRTHVPDVGPLRENEVVSMIAGMLSMDLARHAERHLTRLCIL